jgi:hypothetical protein
LDDWAQRNQLAQHHQILKGGIVMKNKWKFLLMGLVLGLACVFGITTGALADNIRIGCLWRQYQSRRRA